MTKSLQNASDNELAELDDAISKSLYSLTTTFVHVEDYYPEEMIRNLKQFHSLIMSEVHRREEKEFYESEQAHLEDPKEDENYVPQQGDLFEWLGEKYWCIESGSRSGVVNPVGQNYYLRDFYWEFDGNKTRFIRKATPQELERMGLQGENKS